MLQFNIRFCHFSTELAVITRIQKNVIRTSKNMSGLLQKIINCGIILWFLPDQVGCTDSFNCTMEEKRRNSRMKWSWLKLHSYHIYINTVHKLELQMAKDSITFYFCWLKKLAFVLACMS